LGGGGEFSDECQIFGGGFLRFKESLRRLTKYEESKFGGGEFY